MRNACPGVKHCCETQREEEDQLSQGQSKYNTKFNFLLLFDFTGGAQCVLEKEILEYNVSSVCVCLCVRLSMHVRACSNPIPKLIGQVHQ